MTIPELANAINENSHKYDIGELQLLRKSMKNMDRVASKLIFHERTTNDDWAFHYGGRTEIQFNIGLEDEGIRFGLAFSLEPSQALPDVSILYPKIFKLNCLIQEQPALFSAYQMWYWQNGNRSDIRQVSQIERKQIQPNTFIFFGKIASDEQIDISEILKSFDNLLEIYKSIEGAEHSLPDFENYSSEFTFIKKIKNLPQSSSYSSIERDITITVRHTLLQLALVKKLEQEYGEDNVSLENYCRGNRIDVVVKHDSKYYFYEVKVGYTAKSCIRQAIGQLFEYAYGDCKKDAALLFIVGEPDLDENSQRYLNYLANEFKIPIEYLQISL